MSEPNITQIASAVRNITDLKGTSLAVFGALIAISGQVFENKLATILGIGMFVPGLLSGILDISNNYISVSKTIPQNILNSMIGVTAIMVLGFFLVSRTNFVINLLLLSGFTLLISGFLNQKYTPPQPKVEYRFIPRTFQEEQQNPVKISDVFSNMFSDPAPYPVSGYGSDVATEQTGRRTLEYISQPFS